MAPTHFAPHRILVLHLGQLAEVVLSLPALQALRQRFPHSHITLAAMSAGCQLVAMTTVANEFLSVSSVQLSDVANPWALYRWVRFVQSIGRGGYDFTIELPAYGRTNLLTWLARARARGAVPRSGRSLGFLFDLWPPREDPRKHVVDRYLDVLRPLGIHAEDRRPRLRPLPDADAKVEKRLHQKRPRQGSLLIGIYPCSGDLSHRWPVERFVDLGTRLIYNLEVDLLLLGGSRESKLIREINRPLPGRTVVLDDLTIPELASALSAGTVLISDDVGAANLAAAVGTPVLGLGLAFPLTPIGSEHVILRPGGVTAVTVEDAFTGASRLITRDRTSTLFQR
jgi:ADP-heptose:LPS heptosyltransferase